MLNEFMNIPETPETVGALEVWFMDILLFSKKKAKVWPNVSLVVQKCVKAFESYINNGMIR